MSRGAETFMPDREDSADTVLASVSLRDTHFFGGMDQDVTDAFSAAATWHRFHEGQLIFDQQSDSLEVHFIVRGRVRLLTAVDGGEPVTLAEVGAGDVFGELAAIDGLGRSACAIAATDTILGSIAGPAFIDLLERFPKVAARMLMRMAGIIRSMDVRLAHIAVLTPIQRVIAELMRRAEPDSRVPGMWIIPFAPSHGDIASWTGLQKEDVAQSIGTLARDALVRRRGGTLVLLDWAALQALVKPATARPQ
jgi:CRP/FNR family transcriptional regulator, cyclic AMP receptor protein